MSVEQYSYWREIKTSKWEKSSTYFTSHPIQLIKWDQRGEKEFLFACPWKLSKDFPIDLREA